MKRFFIIPLLLLFSLLLMSCANRQADLAPSTDYTQETWQYKIEKNPDVWKKGADQWFFTGEPNATELANRHAPYAAAIGVVTVNVADFTHVKVDGAFQTQIFGASDRNSVYLYGSQSALQKIAVEVRGNTIYIHQTDYAAKMKNVIVRIGIKRLNKLTQSGCGTVEAIQIQSENLMVNATASASGDVYVRGNINVKNVTQNGSGNINLLNIRSRDLSISSNAQGGNVNMNGDLTVHSIVHHGWGDINLIGAKSRGLTILTTGSGKIAINGHVTIKKIRAYGNTCVYAYPINGDSLSVTLCDSARVGLAGFVRHLSIDTYNRARFDGRNLCVQEIFARAHDASHMNLNANKKAFVSATGNSSVYFFGPTYLLSQFSSGYGKIISMGERNWCNVSSEYRPYSYTMAGKGEIITSSTHKSISGRRYRTSSPVNYIK